MNDPTETIRRTRIAELNIVPGSREDLESKYGPVWDTNQLSEEFQAIGFMAPLIGTRAEPAVLALTIMLPDEDRSVVVTAMFALKRLDGKS